MIFIQILLFFNVILLARTTTTVTIQDQIDQLSITNQENILKALLSTSARSIRTDKAENWCCKIDPGLEAISHTQQTTFYVLKTGRDKCGQESCGLFGWAKCTRWCDITWSEIQQGVETCLVYTERVCPDKQMTCCARHIYILGHCLSNSEIYNNQELLEQLSELGIVIPGPPIG